MQYPDLTAACPLFEEIKSEKQRANSHSIRAGLLLPVGQLNKYLPADSRPAH